MTSFSKHRIINGNANKMDEIQDNSIDLVVTSPPYPMIEMWDDIMIGQNAQIASALKDQPSEAFELMHRELDKVWQEVARVLKPGGFACINIGDATRTINGVFALYPNHSRIISAFLSLNLTNLPNIVWRKQTNAPNKFMGSGMLPAGAYVTLEHEWILIFRKGGKRDFKSDIEKRIRRASAFHWEERNIWFSDFWDMKGVQQKMHNTHGRDRSAAYPFEIPYRLINMYSVQGDTVLDPFMGIGTTSIAAITAGRNSIGYEIDSTVCDICRENLSCDISEKLNTYIANRIERHKVFITDRSKNDKGRPKHYNSILRMPVISSQEADIIFPNVGSIQKLNQGQFKATYVNQYLKNDRVG